ncbi:MAG: ArsR/SmtB family transcription factor [Thermoleophilia bacterium]|jgi:ArsR family transcriptional regulator
MNDMDDVRSTAHSATASEGNGSELDEIAAVAKALGHPIRVRIMRILLAQDACMCGQIVDQLPVAQATVSQHLKILRDAGLVRGEIDGPRVCYCVDHAALDRHQALLASLTAGVAPVSCGPGQLGC